MENQRHQRQNGIKPVPLFFLIQAVVGLVCVNKLAAIPADGKNVFFAGFSLERLLLLAGLWGIAIVCLILALVGWFNAQRGAKWEAWERDHRKGLVGFFAVLGIFFGGLAATPAYRFGRLAAYAQRLTPWFAFFACMGVSGFVLAKLFSAAKAKSFSLRGLRGLFRLPFWVFFSLFLLLTLFIKVSGWGITAGSEAWYENSVPILNYQLLSILLVLLALWRNAAFFRRTAVQKRLSFFVIWGLAAALWSLAPMERHFFAPGPYPPNFAFYPYSDAITNDFAAQTALAGLGFNHGNIVFKPVVTFLITLCHLLTGSHMNAALMVQSALLGFVPALLYLFASDLCGCFGGWLAALLLIAQEWNALHTTEVLTVHSRLQMSEFLAQGLFIACAWFTFRWLRQGKNALPFAAAAGGALALLIYTRYNFMAFLPALLLFSLILCWKMKRRWLIQFGVFLAAFLISVSPWILRSYQISGTIAPEIFGSFKVVVVQDRLRSLEEEPAAPAPTAVAAEKPDAAKTAPEVPAAVEKENQPETKKIKLEINPLVDTIGNHFLHNLSALLFALPHRMAFDDLHHVYTAESSLWQKRWDGSLSAEQRVFFLLYGVLLSVGLGALWRKFKGNGLTFFYLLLVYAGSLGVARTSGGRYLVPMNWGAILLFSVGLTALLQAAGWISAENEDESFVEREEKAKQGTMFRKTAGVILCFFAVYGSMFLFEKVHRAALPMASTAEVLHQFAETASTNFDAEGLTSAVEKQTIQLLQGQALYPRFYYYEQGEHGTDSAYRTHPYSRLVFKLMTNDGQTDAVLPLEAIPETFPDHAQLTVLGCMNQKKGYLDVFAVTGTTADGKRFTLIRSPQTEPVCPLAEPVCPLANVCY